MCLSLCSIFKLKQTNISKLMNIDELEDAPLFSFEGQTHTAKVVSVYDGDTIKIIFPFNGQVFKWNCRLSGVDTPELRTRCLPEKKYGYEVRDYLREKILNKVIEVKCGEFDKYGRLLIDIFCKDETCSVNQWLIDSKYAFAYDGGTKQSWKEYLENQV